MRIIFLQILFALTLLSCGPDYKQKKSTDGRTSYFAVREQIIKPQCISCHPSFESHEVLMEKVVGGDPGASDLFRVIDNDQMPPTGRKVPDVRKDYLKRWIEEGANL